MLETVTTTASPRGQFDPLVHWAGRFAVRRAVKRVLLRQTNVVTEWAYWRQASRWRAAGRPICLTPPAAIP